MSTATMTGARAAHSPAMRATARVGLAARAVVYLLMGGLAIDIAIGGSKRPANQQGALAEVASTPGGTVLLVLVAAGFAGYALWRLSQALFNTSPEGSDGKERAKCAARGIVYALLCATAVNVLTGSAGSSQDKQQAGMTASLMQHQGGRWLVGIAGAVVVAVGGYLVAEGVRRKFLDHLNTGRMSRRTRKTVVALGAVGTTARGLVVALAGALVITAAVTANPKESRGLDGALRTLAHQPFGTWLLALAALGLIAFGIYGFAEAKWSRV